MQIDNTDEPFRVKEEAEKQGIICISAMNGDGLEEFCNAIQAKLKVCVLPLFKKMVCFSNMSLLLSGSLNLYGTNHVYLSSIGLDGANRSFCPI